MKPLSFPEQSGCGYLWKCLERALIFQSPFHSHQINEYNSVAHLTLSRALMWRRFQLWKNSTTVLQTELARFLWKSHSWWTFALQGLKHLQKTLKDSPTYSHEWVGDSFKKQNKKNPTQDISTHALQPWTFLDMKLRVRTQVSLSLH